MKLIFGLGNPDKQYQQTRHNLGQIILRDYLAEKKLTLKLTPKFLAQTCQSGQGSHQTIFAVSTGYMNNSGQTVAKLAQFYKIAPEHILVIHDDLDLPIGDLKLQFDRGSAGHNGVKSIIDYLGTQQFYRLRLGIGQPPANIAAEDYVLQNFSKPELAIIQSLTPTLRSTIYDLISNMGR